MSDKHIPYVRDPGTPWSACSTLEEFVRVSLKAGETEVVLALLRSLPEELKVRYRAVWKEWQDEQKGKKT